MKTTNMDKLVHYLSEFIRTGEFLNSPQNTQYSWYLDIFLDKHKNGNRLPFDRFREELDRRLIEDEKIQELDSSNENYDHDGNSDERKRYDLFYNTWYSWSILHDALRDRMNI